MRSAFWKLAFGLLEHEGGQDVAEYVLLTALISVLAVAASGSLATAISSFFTNAAAAVA